MEDPVYPYFLDERPKVEKSEFSEIESVPRADHAAWTLLILLFSVLLSLIGWGVIHLAMPALLK